MAPPNDADRRHRARGEQSLVRALGMWGMAASIVNITIGGGIFRLPAPIAGVLGPSAPIAYLVCAVTMGLIVLCFAEAGSRVSLTGGVYAFVDLSLGPALGFFAGFMLWSWTPNASGPQDRGYTPEGKPAEQVLRKWLAKGPWQVQ